MTAPLPHSPETLLELAVNISRTVAAPTILALEAEPGAANPLNALMPPLPAPREVAEKDVLRARQLGELVGEALRLLGFDTHFALTLDLASEINEAGRNTGAQDPNGVAECGAAYIEGLAKQKVLASARHFPGLGGAAPVPAPSGELPVSGRPMAELWRSDLVPYRRLVDQLSFVLMSAAAYKAYDFDYPRSAVLSVRVVEGLLRAKLKYRGVVVAPQLESPAVRGALDESHAAVESLNAGCDMLLVEKAESWEAMRQGIEEAIASGRLPRGRFEEAVGRVRGAKKGWEPPDKPFSRAAWERLLRRCEEFTSSAGS